MSWAMRFRKIGFLKGKMSILCKPAWRVPRAIQLSEATFTAVFSCDVENKNAKQGNPCNIWVSCGWWNPADHCVKFGSPRGHWHTCFICIRDEGGYYEEDVGVCAFPVPRSIVCRIHEDLMCAVLLVTTRGSGHQRTHTEHERSPPRVADLILWQWKREHIS